MKKIIALLVLFFFFFSTLSFAQEGNLYSAFFERAITLNDNNEYEEAEEQFRKAQQLLLEEFGLNEITYSTYCHILYRRAHNLFLIDGMQDSSYVCFKELYDLSKTPIDTVSGNWFRVESMIMLSTIDLERGNIRECCALLESEKQMIDRLDSDTRLPHKYYFYKNLAKTYNHILVSFLSGDKYDFSFLESPYVIVRDASFYKEYISVYKELVNLTYRFNKDNLNRKTEDLILLAEHCRLPDDNFLAEKTFERALSMWNVDEGHNDITYLRLCKAYLTYRNNSVSHLDPSIEKEIIREFDSIVTAGEASEVFTLIDLLNLYSVRIKDESLGALQKESFISNKLANADNYLLLYICKYSPRNTTLESINNIKILIEYLSLCSIYYYEREDNFKADLLLNKAKFFSFLLPVGDRMLLEEHNNAIAKSAEIIGDIENYYAYKAVNITCNNARGVLPTQEDWLLVCNHFGTDMRIAKLKEGINLFGNDRYDKDLIGFYLGLADANLENGELLKADESIAIADSITKLMERDGEAIAQNVIGSLLLYKAISASQKGDAYNAKMYAKESYNKGNTEAIILLTELNYSDRRELDSIVCNQFRITKSFIQDSYPFLSERERVTFSQSKQFQWFTSIPRYADKYFKDTLLLSIAYNSALISKGTNISVSTEIINKAREANVEALDEFIQQYSISASDTNEVALNNRHFYLEVLEKEMQRFSGVSPQYLGKYFGTWEEISAQLSENEIAVEFVEYIPTEDSNAKNLYLGALYIKKNKHPEIVRICKVTEIDSVITQSIQEGLDGLDGIYDLVWQPILNESQDINRIWFSPSVHLFQTNIESALPESIDAYRVSTTRNILTLNDAPDFSEVALFGGLNFDEKATKTEEGIADNTAYNIMRGSNIGEERVGLTYLKGSLREVTTAQNILSPISHNIRLFVDINGTEDCFKSLSGKGVSLLHIATHGFYIKNDAVVANVGNRIMRRSGLFMSGAKTIWKGSNEKYSGDDGILLSEEIISLDFSKLNLVVLSACGTGLGDPTYDGVYGLQRAFKKAGAQTIIMSLWNVDDNATALMMETFYQELVRTNSKHQAFKKAQNTVRKAFEDPYYWSAFIILD